MSLGPLGRRHGGQRGPWGPAVLGIVLTAVFLLSGGGPFRLTAAPAPAPSNGAGETMVAPAYVPGAGVSDLGPVAPEATLRVLVGLAPSDPSGMQATLALVSTPGSPEYGHFLSASQVADRFAPPPATYARSMAYFEDRGLSVQPSPDRWALTVVGTAIRMGPAFGTTFHEYRSAAGAFIAHPTAARLPSGLPWAGVLGLGGPSAARPLVAGAPTPPAPRAPAATCTYPNFYTPCAIANAYQFSGLLAAGYNGTGTTIGVVDVYDGNEPQTSLASDLASFNTAYSLPRSPVNWVYPVPTSVNLNTTSSGWGSEEALDLEWSHATAPGATIDMTFAPDPTVGLYSSVDWLVAHQAVNVISLSWGEPDVGVYNSYAGTCTAACNASSDGSYTILHPVMTAAALEGIGVFAASGDCGAAFGTNGVATSYPASDPSVTGVGATDLAVSSGAAYQSETAWRGNSSGRTYPGCQNQGGSGGGYSPFPRPAWQSAPGVPSSLAVRGVPDVSIVGGTPVTVVISGYATGVSGTSVSCPIWAGLAAIADQRHGSPLGFLGPALYATARLSNASNFFHDVTSGSNGYAAGTGWDPVTGLGSPIASALLPHLGVAVPTATGLFADLRAVPRTGSAPLAVDFGAIYFNASAPVYGYDIDFGNGNSTWSSSGNASYTFTKPGVYAARAVVFLTDGNSSVSPPLVIVVGGGGLSVTLTPSTPAPAAGANVTLNTTVVGGSPPYRYSYTFGDGTYLAGTLQGAVVHRYPLAGLYCAAVVVADSSSPPNGGISDRTELLVGGAAAGTCHASTPVSATLSAPTTIEIPGDVSFHVTATGGAPPYSVRYVSDDPYVSACNCGIFSRPGSHVVTAFVNDSQAGSARTSVNVTVFPAISAAFAASQEIGTGNLPVNFSALVTGGFGASASQTNWSFGTGLGTAIGAGATYTYGPGLYVATARVRDGLNGSASGDLLIDVRPSASPAALAVGATVLPAASTPSGWPLTFTATAAGGTAPYTYHWDLGNGGSAFGAVVHESYPTGWCPSAGCVESVYLNVTDATGAVVAAVLPIAPATGALGSAVNVSASLSASTGVTPFTLTGTASAGGMPQLNFSWSFGPGPGEFGSSMSYQFLLPGNYTVQLTVTDPYGDAVVRSFAVAVSGVPRTLPAISGGPTRAPVGVAPFALSFAIAPSGGAGGPYGAVWSFGDGHTASGLAVSATYAAAGNYTAQVTVYDAIGTPNSRSWAVLVYNVTPVYLNATASGSPLLPGNAFTVLVVVIPLCTNRSVPGCVAGLTEVSVQPVGGGPGGANLTLNASGVASGVFAAPSAQGTFSYRVDPVGANYTGETRFAITVLPNPGGPSQGKNGSSGLPALWVDVGLLFGAAAVAGAVLAVVLRRRRRGPSASPSPPRSG